MIALEIFWCFMDNMSDNLTLPLVSVILPVYNGSRWLNDAIESVLKQTYKKLELLIVDDGSTDDSKVIINTYAQDKRLHYIYQQNKGFSAAINRGIFESKGDLVGFIGQDDIWLPRKLEIQLLFFAKDPELGLLHSNYLCIDSFGEFLNERVIKIPLLLNRNKLIAKLFLENFIGFETVLVKKNCLVSAGTFDERMIGFSDHDMWLRLAGFSKIRYVNATLVKKRLHKSQVTRRTQSVSQDELLLVTKVVNRYPMLKKVERKKLSELYLIMGINCLRNNNYCEAKKDLRYAVKYRPFAWKAIVAYFVPSLYNLMINVRLGKSD